MAADQNIHKVEFLIRERMRQCEARKEENRDGIELGRTLLNTTTAVEGSGYGGISCI